MSATPKPVKYVCIDGDGHSTTPEFSLIKAYESWCNDHEDPDDFYDLTFYRVEELDVEMKREIVERIVVNVKGSK